MSEVLNSKSFLFNTEVGNVLTKIELVEGYDVEDIIRDRAGSQGRAIKLINLGKRIDPNARKAARTISSAYLNNTTEIE